MSENDDVRNDEEKRIRLNLMGMWLKCIDISKVLFHFRVNPAPADKPLSKRENSNDMASIAHLNDIIKFEDYSKNNNGTNERPFAAHLINNNFELRRTDGNKSFRASGVYIDISYYIQRAGPRRWESCTALLAFIYTLILRRIKQTGVLPIKVCERANTHKRISSIIRWIFLFSCLRLETLHGDSAIGRRSQKQTFSWRPGAAQLSKLCVDLSTPN